MLIRWLIKKHKQKRLSKLPRKRRIFEHQAEPLVDELFMKHKIRAYEIRYARIGHQAPEHLRGKDIEILFFGRNQCEVQLLEEQSSSFFIPTESLDFSPIQSPRQSQLTEGQYVRLIKDIKSDDELKGTLGKQGDELLVIKIQSNDEYPYWVYHEEKREAFRIQEGEFEILDKRILVEIQ